MATTEKVEELGSAVTALDISKQNENAVDKDAPKTTTGYDRWSLLDESTIDYGHLAKTGGAGIEKSADGGYYITTAINYTNGPAHMGHAYEAATSDAIARFERLKGDRPAYFVTGSDEHGQKIANTAADEGKVPIEICDKVRKQNAGRIDGFSGHCIILLSCVVYGSHFDYLSRV
jgi:hypothetical protein